MTFKEQILDSISKQFNEQISLEVPSNPEFGDYSIPCFKLSKKAEELQKLLQFPKFIEKTEIKGPYLNLFINKIYLAKQILKEVLKAKGEYGRNKLKKEKIMFEFSQPNTHKAFHVGHIRGTSLGESISRILEFNEKTVIRANYSGDTGMHIAKWIWCYENFHKNEELNDNEAWIAEIYVDAIKRLAENEKLQEQVDEINRKIENKKDKKINALWKKTRQLSIKSWNRIYKELGTEFKIHFFESEVEIPAKKLAEDLLRKEIAIKSDDAVIMDLKQYNLGVWILLRKDGTVLYSAKDLALAERKIKEFPADKYYVLVGDEQRLHFQQLLKTLKLMNFKKVDSYNFLTYGMVRLPSGKMSSRTGENILYSEFMQEITEYASEEIKKRYSTLKETEIQKRAFMISIAAIKYAMLKQDSNKVIVFDKQEALNFEGDTGPYIQYTYARASSILRKAKIIPKSETITEINEKEKNLIKTIGSFKEINLSAYTHLNPSIIANYSFQLAQCFNEFYHECPVLNAEESIKNSRLQLVLATKYVLKTSLFLLGIEAPEEM